MEQITAGSGTARRNTFKLMIAGALPLAGLAAPAARALAAPAAQSPQQQAPEHHALGDATVVRIMNPSPAANPANPYVNSYLVVRGEEAALIDTGFPGSAPRVEQALASVGLAWNNLRHVILTHYHGDHMGGAPEILARAPRAEMLIGAADVKLANFAAVRPVYDADEVFGLQIIAVPGHSPGHINLVEPTSRSLFTGDSIFNLSAAWEQFNLPAGLNVSLPPYTWHRPLMLGSLRRLQDLEVDRAFFGHGASIEAGAAAELWKLTPEPMPPGSGAGY